MGVPGDHGVPGNQIAGGHGVEEAPRLGDSAVLGVGGDHGVVGDGVAGAHGVEDGDGFVEAAAFGKMRELQILVENKGCSVARGFEFAAHRLLSHSLSGLPRLELGCVEFEPSQGFANKVKMGPFFLFFFFRNKPYKNSDK